MILIISQLLRVIVIGDIMTYLIMNGKKLKPFTLMEPLEDEVIDDILNDMVAPLQDVEGAQEDDSNILPP